MITPQTARAGACIRAWRRATRTLAARTRFLILAATCGATLLTTSYASAVNTTLAIKTITWDVIGLDSNKPSTDGPTSFPLAVRVYNSGAATAENVSVQANLEAGGNQHVKLVGLNPITTASLAPGQVADFYFNISIDRPPGNNNNDTLGYFSVLGTPDLYTKKYTVTATGSNVPVPAVTPSNRQLFVEKILSQNRNSVAPMLTVDNPELPFLAGQIRMFTLFSDTATGYDQQETSINFPSNVFQILSVNAVYTDPACSCIISNETQFVEPLTTTPQRFTTNKVYVDACGWENDFNDPDYHTSNNSCTNSPTLRDSPTGKVGGTIVTTYKVLVVSNIVEPVSLSYLVHDHSGSSYHYNFEADIFRIIPTNIMVAKSAPLTPIEAGDDFTYMITVCNTTNLPADDVILTDTLPACIDFNTADPLPNLSNSNLVQWNIGTLAGGQCVQFEVDASALCDLGECINTATVSTSDFETDYLDNISTAAITVVDTTPPDINCPDDKTLQCTANRDPGTTNGQATGTDLCGPVVITYKDAFVAACDGTGVLTRTWTATDDSGLSTSCNQVLTIVDTTRPTIGDVPDATVECGGNTSSTATGGPPSASDTCGSVRVTSSDGPMSDLCGNTGSFVRTWTATDECGNTRSSEQTITIVDTSRPTIGDVPDATVGCGGNTSSTATGGPPSASDTCGSVRVTSSDGPMSDLCGNTGSFVRTWTATDECGNTRSSEQTITIVDTTRPTISDVPDATVECGGNTSSTATGGPPSASDTCGSVRVTSSDGPMSNGCGNTGSFVRTWTATDDCGNTRSSEQTITIVDTTPPSVTCPADINAPAPDQGSTCTVVVYPTVTATDSCGNATVTFDPPFGSCFACGTSTEVTVTATDECNNQTSCTFTFSVEQCPPTDGCGLTQGYWKNHPEAWPVQQLTLGNRVYTKAECLKILKTPVKKNGLIALAHQLIAAKLNVASGADNSCIASTIIAADAKIGNKVIPPIGDGFLSTKKTSTLNNRLDDYNNGRLCVTHCDDVEPNPITFQL